MIHFDTVPKSGSGGIKKSTDLLDSWGQTKIKNEKTSRLAKGTTF